MKNNLWKSIFPHLIAMVAFMAILLLYYYPVTSGKKLIQNDVIQAQGAMKETTDYGKNGKEEILWSNSSFGGMPMWRGYGSNLLIYPHRALADIIPIPVYMGMIAFIGFYILMLALNANVYISFITSAAFVFSSFNIISIEAGHVNKVLGMATMAPVIGGIIMAYRKKYLAGAAITAFFLSLQIFFAHFQITYYLIIMIVFLGIYEFINAVRAKELKHFFIASAVLVVSALIAVGPNVSQLWTTEVYSKSTTRGGSELTAKKTDSGGLDFDYAMKWSNGTDELLTILIPYYYGGSSNESLGQNSELFKAMLENGIPKAEAKKYIKSIPLYWGDQPFTSGPVYFGAIIFFLFVLGMVLLKDNFKWWVLGVSIFALIISMGKNVEGLSKLLFYNLPLYNKFRSVTMAVCIAQLTFPFIAGALLVKIAKREISSKDFMKGLKWAGGITGFFLIIGLMVSFGADFVSVNDAELSKGFPEWAMDAMRLDRAGYLRMDIFRSVFFIAVTAGILWAFVNEKIQAYTFYAILAVAVIIDLTSVDKRYLNADNFRSGKTLEREAFAMTPADEQILQDKDYYRVYNLTKSSFSDATTSYFHKSIGGYSGIKLGRYQDLIAGQLDSNKNNTGVLNMLNMRYVIIPNQKTGEGIVQRNPQAMGNAWVVPAYKIVANADEEMKSLDSINPAAIAYIDKRFEDQLKGLTIQFDSSASIKLTSYHPNRLQYKSKAATEQLAIFSEIYYQPGWNAYVDGKPVEHFRANYVLRGMRIPAGEHVIDFKFEPAHYFIGEKISFIGSIVLFLFLAVAIGLELRRMEQNKNQVYITKK
jgi:hypothetical protein